MGLIVQAISSMQWSLDNNSSPYSLCYEKLYKTLRYCLEIRANPWANLQTTVLQQYGSEVVSFANQFPELTQIMVSNANQHNGRGSVDQEISAVVRESGGLLLSFLRLQTRPQAPHASRRAPNPGNHNWMPGPCFRNLRTVIARFNSVREIPQGALPAANGQLLRFIQQARSRALVGDEHIDPAPAQSGQNGLRLAAAAGDTNHAVDAL